MRYGDALSEPRGAEFFPRKKSFLDYAARNTLMILEKNTGVFKDTFFAACIKCSDDIIRRQQVGDAIH